MLLFLFLQQLADNDVFLLSMLLLAITQGFKIVWIGMLKKPKPSKGQVRLFVFVLSVPVGLVFAGVELPPLDDPMVFAQEIVLLAGAVLVYSGLAYEYLLNGVLGFLDKLTFAKLVGRSILAP